MTYPRLFSRLTLRVVSICCAVLVIPALGSAQSIDTYFCYNGEVQQRYLSTGSHGYAHQEYGFAGPGRFDLELTADFPFDAYTYAYPQYGGDPVFTGAPTPSRSATTVHVWENYVMASDETVHLLFQVTPKYGCRNCTVRMKITMSQCQRGGGGGGGGGSANICPQNTCWDGTMGLFGQPNCVGRAGASGGRC